MIATPNPAQSESSNGSLPVKSLVETVNIDPADLKSDTFPGWQPPLHKRIPLALARFPVTFCIGIAVTLAWQSYGDAAREMIVNSYPQLGWLAPQAEPVAQSAPKTITLVAPAAHAAPSLDQQPLSAISLHLDAVRQSVDRIAAGQEQMTRNVDQLAAAPGTDGARALQTAGDRPIHPLQELRAFAASVVPGVHTAAVAAPDAALTARLG
jgi:hypothetical protein